MITDYENLFSLNQAITATANSNNVVDLGSERNVGVGEPLGIFVQVTEDFTLLTSLTITINTADNEGMSNPVTLYSETIPVADLVEGAKLRIIWMPRGVQRYVRLTYTVLGTNPGAGKITAGLLMNQDDYRVFPAVTN